MVLGKSFIRKTEGFKKCFEVEASQTNSEMSITNGIGLIPRNKFASAPECILCGAHHTISNNPTSTITVLLLIWTILYSTYFLSRQHRLALFSLLFYALFGYTTSLVVKG